MKNFANPALRSQRPRTLATKFPAGGDKDNCCFCNKTIISEIISISAVRGRNTDFVLFVFSRLWAPDDVVMRRCPFGKPARATPVLPTRNSGGWWGRISKKEKLHALRKARRKEIMNKSG